MQATLLSPDERTVIDAVGHGGDRTLPAGLDRAVHSLEERGWIALVSRGAEIDGEREYTLGLTSYGRLVRSDLEGSGAAGPEFAREAVRASPTRVGLGEPH